MTNPRLAVLAGALAVAGLIGAVPAPGAATATRAKMVLPFIEDDYAKALTQARERKLPLFIESWAPW